MTTGIKGSLVWIKVETSGLFVTLFVTVAQMRTGTAKMHVHADAGINAQGNN